MAYTMIAERDDQKVRKQRESALIVLANARVMESEGWHVVIVDEDGKDHAPAAFQTSLSEKFSWYEVQPPMEAPERIPAFDFHAASEAQAEQAEAEHATALETAEYDDDAFELDEEEAETLLAAEFAAEAQEEAEHDLDEVDESEFEEVDDLEEVDELEEDELEDELAD